MSATLGFCLALVAACSLAGQTAPATLAFEVASVKRSPQNAAAQMAIHEDAGRISYSNMPLIVIVMRAYRTKFRQVVSPQWLGAELYDVSAKLLDGASKEQIPEMLQSLLADRFKFTAHTDLRMVPGYGLVVNKTSSKLKPAATEESVRRLPGPKGLQLKGRTTLARLADVLSDSLDCPVLDRTGLNGIFQIELNWAADALPVAEPSNEPSLFSALQDELGLKLEPARTPLSFLVIDHAEKIPTGN
jgi:uncharacterized protein (TIGR03435 family)